MEIILELDRKYWLDNQKEEIGILKKVDNNIAWLEGESVYYGVDENGLIPLPISQLILYDDRMLYVWCLFSIVNDYNQPDNNLVCVWGEKPNSLTSIGFSKEFSDVIISKGFYEYYGEVTYRLTKVLKGVKI